MTPAPPAVTLPPVSADAPAGTVRNDPNDVHPGAHASGQQVLYVLDLLGWPRSASLVALTVAITNAGVPDFTFIPDPALALDATTLSPTRGGGFGLFSLTQAEQDAAGATRESAAPYGPLSMLTLAGQCNVVTFITRTGADLRAFDEWKAASTWQARYAWAEKTAANLDNGKAGRGNGFVPTYNGWTPFDTDSTGEAKPGLNLPLGLGDLVAAVQKLLSWLLSPSFWRRILLGVAGVLLIGAAVYLIAK